LLALQVDRIGDYTIHLRYWPRAFYAGLAITLLSLGGVVGAIWAYRADRLPRALVWLIE
jgi:hypothetical protein